jgi:hypothetical protein
MNTKNMQILLVAVALNVSLLAMSTEAGAALENYATYQVLLSGVQAPNTPATVYLGASDTQRSAPYAWEIPNTPVPVQVAGSANTGTNQNGYGYAVGHGFASAEAGVLRASALAEAQAVTSPTTNVGAGAVVTALARYTDMAVFNPLAGQNPWQNLLIVSGNLLLTGNMYGSYAEVKVGGTGLNPQSSSAYWTGDSSGIQKSALGVYSTWVPGSSISIPFSVAVYGGQQTELSYWLSAYASAGASFQPCVDSLGGGICDVGQVANSITNADYSHTLAWGGVNVTDWFGRPISFSTTSASGFNYAVAYSPTTPVPEPETYAMMLVGFGLLGFTARRRKNQSA